MSDFFSTSVKKSLKWLINNQKFCRETCFYTQTKELTYFGICTNIQVSLWYPYWKISNNTLPATQSRKQQASDLVLRLNNLTELNTHTVQTHSKQASRKKHTDMDTLFWESYSSVYWNGNRMCHEDVGMMNNTFIVDRQKNEENI